MATITPLTPAHQPGSDSVEMLRNRFTALRLSFTWFGVRRSLSPDQCEQGNLCHQLDRRDHRQRALGERGLPRRLAGQRLLHRRCLATRTGASVRQIQGIDRAGLAQKVAAAGQVGQLDGVAAGAAIDVPASAAGIAVHADDAPRRGAGRERLRPGASPIRPSNPLIKPLLFTRAMLDSRHRRHHHASSVRSGRYERGH